METVEVDVVEYCIPKFWDEEFKTLTYINEPFNDPESVEKWVGQGYNKKITGAMSDMRHRLPRCATQFIEFFNQKGWKNVGLSFYKMSTGTVMPVHRDVYKKYVEIFNLQGQERTIRRALVLLEDWKPGHYLEVNGRPYVDWRAGQTVEWVFDTPHMAANVGLEDRYTLQITGHL